MRVAIQESRSPVELFHDWMEGRLPEADEAALDLLASQQPKVWVAYKLLKKGAADDDDLAVMVAAFEEQNSGGPGVSWGQLLGDLERRMVALGINPAGPRASAQKWHKVPWQRLYDPPGEDLWTTIDPGRASEGSQDQRYRHLMSYVAQAVFDRAGRDSESIGLGLLRPTRIDVSGFPMPADAAEQVVLSVVRILGLAERYPGSRWPNAPGMPSKVRKYLQAVAARFSIDPDELELCVGQVAQSMGIAPAWELPLGRIDAPLVLALAGGRPRPGAARTAPGSTCIPRPASARRPVVTGAAGRGGAACRRGGLLPVVGHGPAAPHAGRGADRPDAACWPSSGVASAASKVRCSMPPRRTALLSPSTSSA